MFGDIKKIGIEPNFQESLITNRVNISPTIAATVKTGGSISTRSGLMSVIKPDFIARTKAITTKLVLGKNIANRITRAKNPKPANKIITFLQKNN